MLCVYVYVYIYIYVCVYVCVCVCIYIYIYIYMRSMYVSMYIIQHKQGYYFDHRPLDFVSRQ
jgi:hypothetical protein